MGWEGGEGVEGGRNPTETAQGWGQGSKKHLLRVNTDFGLGVCTGVGANGYRSVIVYAHFKRCCFTKGGKHMQLKSTA